MAHREFTDSRGIQWEVWSVQPEYAERRRDANADAAPPIERRARSEFRVPIGEQWVDGWLCFESSTEKRRLAPVPSNWSTVPDDELERMCETATPTRLPPRRLIE